MGTGIRSREKYRYPLDPIKISVCCVVCVCVHVVKELRYEREGKGPAMRESYRRIGTPG